MYLRTLPARATLAVASLAMLFLVSGCHTNELAKYQFRGATYRSETVTAANAAESHTHIPSPVHNAFVDVITAVGEGIAGGALQQKVEAVDAGLLSDAVGDGVEAVLKTYADAKILSYEDTTTQPDFIIESHLNKFSVNADAVSSNVTVDEYLRILDRKTAAVIWDDHESSTVLLRFDWVPGPRPVRTAMAVLNLSDLLAMDTKDLQAVLQRASAEAGGKLGETLRSDIADLSKK